MLADGAFDTFIPHALANSIEKKEKSGPVLFFLLIVPVAVGRYGLRAREILTRFSNPRRGKRL